MNDVISCHSIMVPAVGQVQNSRGKEKGSIIAGIQEVHMMVSLLVETKAHLSTVWRRYSVSLFYSMVWVKTCCGLVVCVQAVQ